VVTNYHVVKDAALLRVTLGDTSVTPATVIGFDEDRDVAVLQVPPEVAARVQPLPLGCSGNLMVGQRVYAIGTHAIASHSKHSPICASD
jgi:S1-C subfamily serine protease